MKNIHIGTDTFLGREMVVISLFFCSGESELDDITVEYDGEIPDELNPDENGYNEAFEAYKKEVYKNSDETFVHDQDC